MVRIGMPKTIGECLLHISLHLFGCTIMKLARNLDKRLVACIIYDLLFGRYNKLPTKLRYAPTSTFSSSSLKLNFWLVFIEVSIGWQSRIPILSKISLPHFLWDVQIYSSHCWIEGKPSTSSACFSPVRLRGYILFLTIEIWTNKSYLVLFL